jgi:nitrogen fixation NifU-like protein
MEKERVRMEKMNFWQNHSTNYLEMAFRYDKRKRLPHPTGYGKRTGVCGDTIEMFLLIEMAEFRRFVSIPTDA